MYNIIFFFFFDWIVKIWLYLYLIVYENEGF